MATVIVRHMSADDLKIVIPVVTAAISFVAAVVAVVVGQLLGQRFQRNADERRWSREDAARRRLKGEESARASRRALLDAARLFDDAWEEAQYRSSNWRYPSDEDVQVYVDRAEEAAIEIPDDAMRLFIRHAGSALVNADDANQGGANPPWVLSRSVAAETDAVIGAYLRGERLPKATEVEAAVDAAGSWQAEVWANEEKHREQEAARRSAADSVGESQDER